MDGILLVDKPQGYTSHDVVAIVKRAFSLRKVGHTGTLDPLATGILPLCINAATKIAGQFINSDKAYEVTLKWGESTTTYDSDGECVEARAVAITVPDQLPAILGDFLGTVRQTPPAYSAVKVGGKPLYWWARKGNVPPIASRDIVIHTISILSCDHVNATLYVECGKGTFIRSLVHDIGERLGCGAHVVALRRLQSGGFKVADAISLDEIKKAASNDAALAKWLIPLDAIKCQ